MYLVKLDDQIVYACTDAERFRREAARYASIGNATFWLNGKQVQHG